MGSPGQPELKPDLHALIQEAYDELRRVARHGLAALPPGQSLAPTELVNEALLRLLKQQGYQYQGKEHLIRVTAQAMHNILVDRARRKKSAKHGGRHKRVDYDNDLPICAPSDDMLAFNEACESLKARSVEQYELVLLRVYVNLTIEEIAAMQGRSTRTVERQWTFAKAVLQAVMSPRMPTR